MKKIYLLLLAWFFALPGIAQSTYITAINPFVDIHYADPSDSNAYLAHTSIQPYLANEIINADTLKFRGKSNFFTRKLFNEHLLSVKGSDYELTLDFLPDWVLGYDESHNVKTGLNTRGFEVRGTITNKFSFYSYFYENQGSFPKYVSTYIDSNKIIPGQGHIHTALQPGYDFSSAGGYISYTPIKYFNFQFGHDKNFIGDGYRSLILSDNTFNYPFLKITTNIWHIRYVNLYAQMMDFSQVGFTDSGIPRKYISAHYLDWNITRRLSLGLYEVIVFANSLYGAQGFDVNYFNPVIFFRPVEFSVGSSNNALLAINSKYKLTGNTSLYGQFVLDEFTIAELKAGNGYWANKFAGQLGVKSVDIIGVNNLDALTEINFARPFTYSHNRVIQNYGHYNQPLAHPLGANFYESVSIVNYSKQRFNIRLQGNYAVYGKDSLNGKSDGKNIYVNYNNRRSDYGNFIGQGVNTSLLYTDLRVGYLLNPKTNLRLEAGYIYRNEYSNGRTDITNYFTFGLRSSFRNLYYDF